MNDKATATDILKFRMPSDDELRATCSRKYAVAGPYMIDQWPESVAALSFPTKLVALDAADVWGILDDDDAEAFKRISDELDSIMGRDNYFVRLNSRSPKDAAYPGLPITCSGKQALSWILSSERCVDDTSMMQWAGATIYICLRQPRWLEPELEYRCFAKNGEVLGLSYYFYDRPPTKALPDAEFLLSAARSFYAKHLAAHFETVVFDLYAPGTAEELLIEVNPYGLSDPCLFVSYDEVEKGGVRLPASGMEARRAAAENTDAVHDSPTAESGDAQRPPQ